MLLKFLPLLLKIQDIMHSMFSPYRKFEKINNKNKLKKTFLNSGASMVISSEMEKKRKKVSALAKTLLKKYLDNPSLLLKFISSKGTKIVCVKNIDKAFLFMKEEEGFIPERKGLGALKLSLIINLLGNRDVKIGFNTPEMLLMKTKTPSIYFLAHYFHHWISYKNNLPGYDEDSLRNFKNVYKTNLNKINFNTFSVNQILSLKDIIERDKDAIDFVREFVREQIGAKELLNKVQAGEKANI